MKNQANSRVKSPSHDAHGGKSVEIERFAWVNHAKSRGIAAPEYLGCGDAWDESPSRGAHTVRPATAIKDMGDGTQIAMLPAKPELPELPPLARTGAQLAILVLDAAAYKELRAAGRVGKVPSRTKRAPRKGGLVSAHLADFRAPVAPPVAAGRICTTRAISSYDDAPRSWCAAIRRTLPLVGCDRGAARYKRVRQQSCHTRRVKHVACVAHTPRTADTRRKGGTIIAALPLTPAIVRAVEGVSARRDIVSRIAEYAAARGWHRVCPTPETTETPAQAAMTVPTPPAQAVRRVIPVDVALARGLLARKLQVIGHIDAVVTPRVTQD